MKHETVKDTQEQGKRKVFYHLLGNTLVTSVMNFTVWFAIIFFVYLETKSVFASALLSGVYLVLSASTGFWFGSIVDHHKKKTAMLFSTMGSLLFYIAAFIVYLLAGSDTFKDPASLMLWVFVGLISVGVILGNIRMIAMPTVVTLLVPAERRDKANGLVGSVAGVAAIATSVISGLLVGLSGMYHVLLLAIIASIVAGLHLLIITVPEKGIVHSEDTPKKIDIRGTFKIIAGVPGLFALILFTTLNNFLAGAVNALADPYGLSLVSVEVWGLLLAVLTSGFMIGGLIIAKKGLGKNPLRALLLVNVAMWLIAGVFTIQASILLFSIGLFLYMLLIPFVEASEQTILQKLVPYERQGRVFGFAQSIEHAAAPLMAFIIGPITQFIFIPFMTTGAGVDLIGSWFGTGPARGMAVVFTLTAVVGLVATLLALMSKYYRALSTRYQEVPIEVASQPLSSPDKKA
ncbi:MAG TPA: MFS transporter [Candidatus Saccharimonadales bacterium]|nr:MFS transporter [Candidatus Saccharimonadales bacterium]